MLCSLDDAMTLADQNVALPTRRCSMNTMTLDGYSAKVEYDAELDLFRGEVIGLSGGADFYGKTPQELCEEFHISLRVYLDVCKEKNIEPGGDAADAPSSD